jgi:hypothetical protein
MPLATALPTIPQALSRDLSDVERELYYVAMKDRSETARAANRPNAGVSFGGMPGSSDYTPKTHGQMVAEAEANVARRAQDRAAA